MADKDDLSQAMQQLRIKGLAYGYDYFARDDFAPRDVIEESLSAVYKPVRGAQPSDHAWDHRIQDLLDSFKKLDAHLAELGSQVQAKCASLQDGAAADGAAHLARISAAERELEALSAGLQALEARGNALTSFAGRLGARLQGVDAQRGRAVAAAAALRHVAAFSRSEDLSALPPVFHDPDRMEEAASLAAKLSEAIDKVVAGPDGEVGAARRPASGPPPPGTLAAAAEQLELYRNVLDNRVVSRFDAAAAAQDFAAMADCARIMAASGPQGDALLISRYISTRPMFTAPPEAAPAPAAPPPPPAAPDAAPATDAAAVVAMRSLTDLFSRLSAALRGEAVVLEQVFFDPGKAVGALTQRTFDELVAPALEAALVAPPQDASSEALRSHLRLLAEAYRKAAALAEEAAELAGPAAGLVPADLADGAAAAALQRYMALEMAWLGGLGAEKLGDAGAGAGLSRELVLDLMAMNEEAVKRCVQVTPPLAAPPAVRLLFYSPNAIAGGAAAAPAAAAIPQPSLLSQAGAHLLVGIEGAADRCVRRLAGAFRPGGPGADRAAAARSDAAASLGTLLQAIAQAAELVATLAAHCDRVIAPHVGPAAAEAAACGEGLSRLVAAVDARVAAALERTLAQLFRRVAAVLAAEQLKSDFRPAEGGAAALDTPTPAAAAAVAALRAVGEQAGAHLHGANLSAFMAALSRRAAATVEAHARRFTFSPEGALRWRRDVAEFAACLAALGARAAAPAFEDLYSLAGLLIVPPDSLPGLLDGVGHLPAGRVRAVAERREDWKTARVGDRPLAALF